MLKKVGILLLISTNLSATLTETEVAQLQSLQGFSRRNYDMDLYVSDQYSHIEVPRAIARVHCLELLQDGSSKAYQEFVTAQDADCLSFANFKRLASYIQSLSEDKILLIRKAIIITAVSLTSQVLEQMPEAKCLGSTLDVSASFVRATKAERQMYCIFPPATNFRHMLFTESGNNMFKTLQTMIQLRYMGQQELDLWFAYWIVNTAGFRGQVEQRGSIYITEPVANAMLYLKDLLDQMLLAPEYPVLSNYLQYRVRLIGLQEMPVEQQAVFGHLAGILHLYTPLQGRILYSSFMQLSTKTRCDLERFFNYEVHTYEPISYIPAFFSNAMLYTNNNFSLVFAKLLPIYMEAVRLSDGKGVSLNQLSKTTNIAQLLTTNKPLDFEVNSDRELMLVH